jgi:P27 family predicted phage terminase small subunit
MRGRKPTPTALKRLRGVEPRRINHLEPVPLSGLPECPKHFTAEQAELWEFALTNAPPGMVKSLDAGLLEAWCVAYSIHRAATAELSREGGITVPGIKEPDRRVAAPQIGIINRTAALLSRLSGELGFSPTARSRVRVPTPFSSNSDYNDPPSQSLDEFLLEGKRLHAKLQAEPAKKH